MKFLNLAILTALLAASGTSLAAGGSNSGSDGGNGGNGGNGGGDKVDDNPSASDLYVLQYGAEKQNDADTPDMTESELEILKVTPPPVQTPTSNFQRQWQPIGQCLASAQ